MSLKPNKIICIHQQDIKNEQGNHEPNTRCVAPLRGVYIPYAIKKLVLTIYNIQSHIIQKLNTTSSLESIII